jgi:hypothetical protein
MSSHLVVVLADIQKALLSVLPRRTEHAQEYVNHMGCVKIRGILTPMAR